MYLAETIFMGLFFCSLGRFFVSPSLVRALVERWDATMNTFLFSHGEHIVTLLDMKNMAGLPLDGEPYDEFIPVHDHLDHVLLLYPKALSVLMKAWQNLEEKGRVTFQKWCDHFYHNSNGPLHPDSNESSTIYTAAFLAL